jgi:hypothetical protein
MKSPKRSVTLEDLLQFKRSEQPAPEFWNEFERELRAKQLAAIVEPRRWWAPLIRVGSRFNHLQVPIGAAAILAVTLITIRDDGQLASAPKETTIPVAEQSLEVRPLLAVAESVDSPTSASTGSFEPMPVENSPEQNDHMVAPARQLEGEALAASDAPALEREPTPSARYIAANLAAAQEADPRLMDDVFGNSLRHAQSRQPIRDPLAHVSSPAESRRSRLLATALPVAAGGNELVAGTAEPLRRKLTEERLYDSISRVGLRGDRVAIKF